MIRCTTRTEGSCPDRPVPLWSGGRGRRSGQVAVDVVPVDVVAEPGLRRDVDVALVVHRVNGLVQPGRRRVVVDERVEQAALVVEAGADHRAERVQVTHATAVDFYIHTIGLVDGAAPR